MVAVGAHRLCIGAIQNLGLYYEGKVPRPFR